MPRFTTENAAENARRSHESRRRNKENFERRMEELLNSSEFVILSHLTRGQHEVLRGWLEENIQGLELDPW